MPGYVRISTVLRTHSWNGGDQQLNSLDVRLEYPLDVTFFLSIQVFSGLLPTVVTSAFAAKFLLTISITNLGEPASFFPTFLAVIAYPPP